MRSWLGQELTPKYPRKINVAMKQSDGRHAPVPALEENWGEQHPPAQGVVW